MNHCIEIGSHKHGCCVMQRCLEKGRESQKLSLADVIIHQLSSLIEDPYGNYLVQNVLKLNNYQRNDIIFRVICGDFVRLSQLKFSSNVIEKVKLHSLRFVVSWKQNEGIKCRDGSKRSSRVRWCVDYQRTWEVESQGHSFESELHCGQANLPSVWKLCAIKDNYSS